MGKSMVNDNLRITPFLPREINDPVEYGDDAPFSDFINMAVSSFPSSNVI